MTQMARSMAGHAQRGVSWAAQAFQPPLAFCVCVVIDPCQVEETKNLFSQAFNHKIMKKQVVVFLKSDFNTYHTIPG